MDEEKIDYDKWFSEQVEVKENPFKLSSGRDSRLYINLRNLSADTHNLGILADGVLELAAREAIQMDSVVGVAEGCTPLGIITSYLLGQERSAPVPVNMIRGATKKHGSRKNSEFIGNPEGQRILLLEDVTTTGKSLVNDIFKLEEAGARVTGVITLVDRLEITPIPGKDDPSMTDEFATKFGVLTGKVYTRAMSVSQVMQYAGIPFYSLTTAHSLLSRLKDRVPPNLMNFVREEYEQYGAQPLTLE